MFFDRPQRRVVSPEQRRSHRLKTIAEEDLSKITRPELLKTAKKLGIQNLYKKYLSKNYLVELIQAVTKHQNEVKQLRGKTPERLYKKRSERIRITKSGMEIKSIKPSIRTRASTTYEQTLAMLHRLSKMVKNSRQIIRLIIRKEDGQFETVSVKELIDREHQYGRDGQDYKILKAELCTLPQRGGCDTIEHTINSLHYLPNGQTINMTLRSTKTTNNNCLINIFAKTTGKKQVNAQNLRKQLGLQEGHLVMEVAEKLSLHFAVSYKLFTYRDNQIQLVQESEQNYQHYVEIFLDNKINHYYVIKKRPDDLSIFKPQLQIEEKKMDVQMGAEKVVQLNEQQQDEHLPQYSHEIQYAEVLNDPNIDIIKDRIYNSDKHVVVYGQGGVGKTWTINQITNALKTATTGIAATHIKGNTIHHYLKTKFKDVTDEIIIIDEISMMGTSLFQQLYEMIEKSKVKRRLVMFGDILQLPPVLDGFFFQCYDFVKFAKKCIRINLTQIKRQDNVEQQIFLNDLRVGKVDHKYMKKLQNNKVSDPQVIICSKNEQVDKYNEIEMKKLTAPKQTFKPSFIYDKKKEAILQQALKKAQKEYQTVQLCQGLKVMLLHNISVDTGLVNGRIGIVEGFSNGCVNVNFGEINSQVPLIKERIIDDLSVSYIPLRPCYAITIHKSQGCTFDSAIVEFDGLFENGQAYVALSRVRNLDNLQIKGKINEIFTINAFKPNKYAYEFLFKNLMITQSEIMMINHSEKQLKGVKVKKHQDISNLWNHIYFDFETYLSQSHGLPSQIPYYNKIKHFKNGKVIYEQTLFDQRWDGGQRCDVGGLTWEYIKSTMIQHGDDLKKLKDLGTDSAILMYKAEKKKIPTIIAYNGSGFDFHFILKKFLNDKLCSRRFEISNIFKGSHVTCLIVRDKVSGEMVLKSHDMCEILLCPLKKALTDFCKGSVQDQVVEKLEFKDEILYIMNNYEKNPNILKPNVVSTITKRLYTEAGIIEKEMSKQVCLYDEVIKYADNDTDVLHTLYLCLDKICKDTLISNITSFPTAGSMAWYGMVSNLPKEALQEEKKYDHNRNKISNINSKLFRLEMKELEFVKKSIKGAKCVPRIHQVGQDKKYVYLDISGMYASIMKNEIFPYGKARFANEQELAEINKYVKSLQDQYKTNKLSWRDIYSALTKKFGLFIADCDFEENKMNLEPVLQYNHNSRTYYTVQRREDTIGSVIISLIINSGGQIFDIKRVLLWENHGQILEKWIQKCNAIKEQGQRENNSGVKTFGKLLANSAYGQTLMTDKNEVIRFINTFEDADDFVNNNALTRFFEMDEYDVYVGKKQISAEKFITSRCQYIGSFVLEYSKAMVHDICEAAMPNRYSAKGIYEQPLYGDTDSLVFQDWQAELLIKAGWVKFENGKLTDELGEKSYWFLPDRLRDITVTDRQGKVFSVKDGFNDLVHEAIWKNATEDEKRDPKNFHFYYVVDGVFAAPKSYACKYQNHEGTKIAEKMKFKGIPTTALIGDKTLDYNLIKEAYNNPDECYVATLQSKPQVIKNFSKREGERAFLEIVDSNLRRNKFVQRQLFKTRWQGRHHIDNNYTVPYGFNGENLLQI